MRSSQFIIFKIPAPPEEEDEKEEDKEEEGEEEEEEEEELSDINSPLGTTDRRTLLGSLCKCVRVWVCMCRCVCVWVGG